LACSFGVCDASAAAAKAAACFLMRVNVEAASVALGESLLLPPLQLNATAAFRRMFISIGGGGRQGQTGRGVGMGGGVGACGSSLENLHAMVEGVSHDDAAVAVDGNAATRAVELSVA